MTRPGLIGVAIATATLVGTNISHGFAILTTYWWSDQLPATPLFQAVLYWVWVPVAVIAATAGVMGAYSLALEKQRARVFLLIFGLAFTLVIKVDGYELGWSFIRFALNFSFGRVAIGINIVGFALLIWLFTTDLVAKKVPSRFAHH